ncbi:hypothetical protein [Ornithobacterium rhinotracheale]|uniref:Uncharacterized protein n=2 Tax=Ornithobacterium rhinotracheale TaxID=28251 RepID=I3ZX52_ORNRL|nr:hypothetical protein [Ornithobacterium rhinotracheale]AFL96286.1 hypothetical protein Ornrh_0055 [Ornithobacterium rhinotracheale DSM 15997]AIQ00234.1 hypothetical protein Q785_00275 [Ornithobacterium rhinotracheale ORT-UMN 88]KGB67948.1 hypothetical protein Q787_00275 [Ornithobacterium rhinotracheale H06-030791]MCK0200975.1 hypothetical protein [Ornithobacterium rhinotracheale]MCK0201465.1 hypothetical protein [Ornithobacterium rhinotracheale]
MNKKLIARILLGILSIVLLIDVTQRVKNAEKQNFYYKELTQNLELTQQTEVSDAQIEKALQMIEFDKTKLQKINDGGLLPFNIPILFEVLLILYFVQNSFLNARLKQNKIDRF